MQTNEAPDLRLKEWATARQAEYIDALIQYRTIRAAALALHINPSMIVRGLKAVKRKAALRGYAPSADMTRTVPAPFVVKGTSTLYDDKGQMRLQWVKTKLDGDQVEEAIRDFVTWLAKDAEGKAPKIKLRKPARQDNDLLAVYPMGDPHFGLYAWAEEAGEDFDLSLAEKLTTSAIDRLVASAPPASTALIAELGDFFHTDNATNRTNRSGNSLDIDSRWAKVMQVGLRAMIYCILRALAKHRHVIVRIVKGNHDEHSSFALALALDAYFSKNKRVTIVLSPAVFWYFRFGKVLLGVAHGDTCKPKDLPAIMACDRPADWGEAKFRYWYQGHIHHDYKEEFPGVVVEAFRTLAARDAWHAGEGYRAGRDMTCIVHHRLYGEVERHRCDIAMLLPTETKE